MGNSVIALRGFYNPDLDLSRKGKKSKKSRKNTRRREMLLKVKRMLKLHEHAPLSGVCLAIHEQTGWPIPDRKFKQYRYVKQYLAGGNSRKKRSTADMDSDKFYRSPEWRALRYTALKMAEGSCSCCGARASDGVQIHVDHIIPRSIDPGKALDLANLQLLCEDCNIGKGNFDATDWR